MGKLFHVVITEVDPETNAEKVVNDEMYTGLTCVADCADTDGKMSEIILHDNLSNMAAKLAAGQKTSKAVRLAALMMEFDKEKKESVENALIKAIMGDD